MGIDIKHNIGDALAQIEAIDARARDLSPVTKVMASKLNSMIVDGFTKEQDPFGDPWKPLSEATIKRRRKGRSKRNPKILQDTAQMRLATHTRAEKNTILFGTSGAPATYAPTHLFGTKDVDRRAHLPVDKKGTPDFSKGPAKRWFDQLRERLGSYITQGKL